MGKPVCNNEGCNNPVKVRIFKNGKTKARQFCSKSCRADHIGRRNFYAKGGVGEYKRKIKIFDHEQPARVLAKEYDGRCKTCGCRVLGVYYCSDSCSDGRLTDKMFKCRPSPEPSAYMPTMSESERKQRKRSQSRPKVKDNE